MSYSESVTLGIKAEECPHFASVLRCSVSSMYSRDYCCECGVHYVTITVPTILIFKDMQHITSVSVKRDQDQNQQCRSFLLSREHGSPQNGEVVQHIPQPEQSHTCQQWLLDWLLKRGGISSRISPYPNMLTQTFCLETLWIAHRAAQSSSWADQKCKLTTTEIRSHFQAWCMRKSNSWLHPEDLI